MCLSSNHLRLISLTLKLCFNKKCESFFFFCNWLYTFQPKPTFVDNSDSQSDRGWSATRTIMVTHSITAPPPKSCCSSSVGNQLLSLNHPHCCCWSQSVVRLDGDKLIHVQKWDGKETDCVREIKDGKMVVVSTSSSSFLPITPSTLLSFFLSSCPPPFQASLLLLPPFFL